jgi:aldose 1-epimerase
MNNDDIKVSSKLWGEYDGQPVYLFKLENANGACVGLTNYGATLVSAVVPDAHGVYGNAVLGFSSLQAYIDDECYVGSTIGRYANRISGAKFELDDTAYYLEANDGQNTNHGGNRGFNSMVFQYAIIPGGVSFTLFSPDGESGFPGNLDLKVTYRWTALNELITRYEATSDKKTVANFTNHAYFNLSANCDKIFDHQLTIFADEVLEKDSAYIPTGLTKPADDLYFKNSTIRNKMMVNKGELTGLNDCYLLNENDSRLLKPAAQLVETKSKRKLEVFTTYPSIIVYTGDFLQSTYLGHHLRPYGSFDGICLECQYYPDSPNHSNFPSTVLEAGELYDETIIYKFS